MAKISPQPIFRAFDNNGDPLVGGKLYTYDAGTTTPKATFTDASGNTPNTNPVILDQDGEANVWLGDGAYKYVLDDANDVTQWTVDNIVGDTASAFGSSFVTTGSNLNITTAFENTIVLGTASLTLSLLSASTAGEGFYFIVKNTGTGNITIDPDGAETINGEVTFLLPPEQSISVNCDGTTWYTLFNDTYYRKRNVAATNPTVNDDSSEGYDVYSEWVNSSTTEKFTCLDATVGAAVWELGTLDSSDLGEAAVLDLASQAEAEAGTSNTVVMTPLRSSQAIAALVSTTTSSAWIDFAASYTGMTSSNTVQPHGLGAQPDNIVARLVCLSNSQGYTAGEIVYVNASLSEANSGVFGLTISGDATNVTCTGASSTPVIFDKSTFATSAITAANWKLQFKAIIYP